jgi:predicted PurR-regulated permease PerM
MIEMSPADPKPVTPPPAPDAARGMTVFVMVVATLYFGKEVLVPVTLALLLAFMLAPLMEVLRRLYLGRVPSVLVGVLLALGIISAVGGVIGSQISDLTVSLPSYVATVETKVANVRHYTIGQLTKLANSVGRHKDGSSALSLSLPALQPPPTRQQPTELQTEVAQQATSPFGLVQRYLTPVLTPLANMGIVFVVALFALLQREDLRDRLIRLIGSDDLHRTTLAIDDAARRLSKYFITQMIINTMFGIVIGIGLLVIGVPNPVLWGILSALLRFVPYVGAFISAVLPLALAAAVEPGWSMMLSTAVLYATAEAVTGQVIEPLLYSHSTGMSPFSVVVAAIFWSWLWGPVGLILSTPLTLCLVVLGRHIKRLEFLDVMLGDRSPLTPVESFYQRVLAGDADEVLDHAEKLLKERSLSTYYDEVAIKGLQLATSDAQRGAVDSRQLERIQATVKHLVAALDRRADKQPTVGKSDGRIELSGDDYFVPQNPDPHSVTIAKERLPAIWRGDKAIMCVAGRGALDDAATEMLAQLLAKHGLSSRQVSYNDVSRDKIATLDTQGVAMACLVYLNISGSPAHLSYLIQRLRQHLPPDTPILVGIWQARDLTLNDAKQKINLGADYYVSSLEQAVTFCADAAQRSAE